jgi:uroporphyrinogen decarboxylase
MTPRELVRRCLEFDHPERVPRETWLLPIAFHEHGESTVRDFLARWPSDIDRPAVPNEALAALTEGDAFAVGQYRDEWGCVFDNVQAGP